jgi:hypothetical protein
MSSVDSRILGKFVTDGKLSIFTTLYRDIGLFMLYMLIFGFFTTVAMPDSLFLTCAFGLCTLVCFAMFGYLCLHIAGYDRYYRPLRGTDTDRWLRNRMRQLQKSKTGTRTYKPGTKEHDEILHKWQEGLRSCGVPIAA